MLRRFTEKQERLGIARLLVEKDLDDVQRLLVLAGLRVQAAEQELRRQVHDRVGQDLLEMPNRLRDQRSRGGCKRGIAGDRSLHEREDSVGFAVLRFNRQRGFGGRYRLGRSAFAREDTRQLRLDLGGLRHEGDRPTKRGDRLRHLAIVLEPPALEEKIVGLGDRIGRRGGGRRLQQENAGKYKC